MKSIFDILPCVVAILGGLIASSTYIVSKKPKTHAIFDKLVSLQVGIGLILLALLELVDWHRCFGIPPFL